MSVRLALVGAALLGASCSCGGGGGTSDARSADTTTDVARDTTTDTTDDTTDDAPSEDTTPDVPAGTECTFEPARSEGNIDRGALDEISGLVTSDRNPGLMYAHNDSGDDHARVFVTDRTGADIAELRLARDPLFDAEAIALGPSEVGGPVHIVVGDIGDNNARTGAGPARESVFLVRFVEPDIELDGSTGRVRDLESETIELRYEDGPRDAESLFIDPETADVYIVSKESGSPTGLYRAEAPLATDEVNSLQRLGDVDFDFATGADIRADGRAIIVRGYLSLAFFLRAEGQSIADALAEATLTVPSPGDAQGEAVAFFGDMEVATTSEGENPPMRLIAYSCD